MAEQFDSIIIGSGQAGIPLVFSLASKGINVLEGRREIKKIARAKEKAKTYGFMSVLVNADTDQIIGACVLGSGGDEIVTSILNVIYSKQPYKLIGDSMVLHPTISELISTTLENLSHIHE